jgi:1,4-dihydroxy-2-naphthoate octaprenyltransferase
LTGGIVALALGCLIGLYFVAVAGPLVLIIGVAGALVVVLYTAGPYPLAYIGLGEIAVFIFMGPLIVLGAYYVLTEQIEADPLWASLPIAFLVANILHANNLRDLEADAAQDKHTLAVLMGRRFAQAEYVFLNLGAFVAALALTLARITPWPTLAVIILLPEAGRLIRIAAASVDPAELHGVLLGTARLHKWFGAIYVAAWVLGLLILD